MHYPVLLREVIKNLDPKAGNVIVDATLGGGGHAKEILGKILPGGKLIAIDKDPEAIERVRTKFRRFKEALIYFNEDFRKIQDILEILDIKEIDGAVFDLGMSSFQVDDENRGFSFLRDGLLDMRFDRKQKFSARDVVNSFGREELAEIIKKYGEERHAKLIAGAIYSARKKRRIGTTGELRDIVVGAVGRKYRKQRLHPAARTFQALRIYVNDELSAVEEAIRKTVPCLRAGARICVISFHSLEDRIVKNVFREYKKAGQVSILTKKPLTPGKEEIKDNPRSRSAKLRVAEKTV